MAELSGTTCLSVGDSLLKGQQLRSPNNRYQLVFQYDGNVVCYDGNKAYWATNTWGQPATHLIMQHDHNLVLYAGKRALWASNTCSNTTAINLIMQDDRLLQLWDEDGIPCWNAGGPHEDHSTMLHHKLFLTGCLSPSGGIQSLHGEIRFRLGVDKTVFIEKIENEKGTTIWTMPERGIDYMVLQNDGNFVYYTKDCKAVAASNTAGCGAKAVMGLKNGDVVLVDDVDTTPENVHEHIVGYVVKLSEGGKCC